MPDRMPSPCQSTCRIHGVSFSKFLIVCSVNWHFLIRNPEGVTWTANLGIGVLMLLLSPNELASYWSIDAAFTRWQTLYRLFNLERPDCTCRNLSWTQSWGMTTTLVTRTAPLSPMSSKAGEQLPRWWDTPPPRLQHTLKATQDAKMQKTRPLSTSPGSGICCLLCLSCYWGFLLVSTGANSSGQHHSSWRRFASSCPIKTHSL